MTALTQPPVAPIDELKPDLNIELCLGLLLGPMLYWKVFQKKKGPDDAQQLANAVVDAFWKAFAK